MTAARHVSGDQVRASEITRDIADYPTPPNCAPLERAKQLDQELNKPDQKLYKE
jgi:hypothetical protein